MTKSNPHFRESSNLKLTTDQKLLFQDLKVTGQLKKTQKSIFDYALVLFKLETKIIQHLKKRKLVDDEYFPETEVKYSVPFTAAAFKCSSFELKTF